MRHGVPAIREYTDDRSSSHDPNDTLSRARKIPTLRSLRIAVSTSESTGLRIRAISSSHPSHGQALSKSMQRDRRRQRKGHAFRWL